MSQEWLIEVLTDIRHYSRKHKLPGLSEVLDDAIIVAAGELKNRSAIVSAVGEHDSEAGNFHRGVEEHKFPG